MKRVLFSVLFAAFAAPAAADSLEAGLGVGLAPEYEGADEYMVLPLPRLKYETDVVTFETSGLGVAADIVTARGFDGGPIIRWNMGRSDVDDAVVDRLDDVDGGLELGGYIGLSRPIATFGEGAPLMATGRFEFTQAVGGHEGLSGTVSAGLVKPFGETTVGASVFTTFSSDDYADAFFSVDARDSARSGLARYDAEGGLKSFGLTAFASHQLTEKWSINGFGSYSRLVGDAADSPIVDIRGDANQAFIGFGFSYRFF